MSATAPISSVMAVDGVSGEMATPAFMFRACMALISEIALAAQGAKSSGEDRKRDYLHVASIWKQYSEPPASAMSSTH